jgi:DNA-binding NtrC family response regulator
MGLTYTPPEIENTVLSLDEGNAHPLSIRAKSLVFHDPLSRQLLELIKRVAPSTAPILLGGESGTGKELVARHVHALSHRSGPFVAVNCGAITEHLAESELFGHEAGAFTGASARRAGWFEAANGGTLFLDEIGDLPLNLQVKLLRVLQEQEVVRLGSRKPIPVDVRLVAATNIDLEDAVSAGHFRLDLYYRLNIVEMSLPPLRDRVGDILPLARHFLCVYGKKLQLPQPVLSTEAIRALEAYAWPGNIRELENVMHYALLLAGEDQILPRHLKLNRALSVQSQHSPAAPASPSIPTRSSTSPHSEPINVDGRLQALRNAFKILFENPGTQLFNEIEQALVVDAFRESGNNQVRSAALLGISRNVLRTLLKKHGLLQQDGTLGPLDALHACDLSA